MAFWQPGRRARQRISQRHMELPQSLGEKLCDQPSNQGAGPYGKESLTQWDEASTSAKCLTPATQKAASLPTAHSDCIAMTLPSNTEQRRAENGEQTRAQTANERGRGALGGCIKTPPDVADKG